MPTLAMTHRTPSEVERINAGFYDALWGDSTLVDPQRFNTWPMVRDLAMALPRRLEVAPGLRPRLPLDGTVFVDISQPALNGLRAVGARATRGRITALPCADAGFDLICALDILEHIVDDDKAMRELTRVASSDARMLLSVPLHAAAWSKFDDFVGHYRRYEPEDIEQRLAAHGWRIERSAVYGMQPASNLMLSLGQWYLSRHWDRALWWYNKVIMPLGLKLQRPLRWHEGLCPTKGVDEVLLVCRRV